MNEDERASFVVSLVDGLVKEGWVGKTHIQKAMYFAQQAAGLQLDFRYVIHYYGPYSFELDSFIQSLESQGVLNVVAEPDGYGYRVSVGETTIEERLDDEMKKRVQVIAGYFGGLNAGELELLSTSYYVLLRFPGAKKDTQIREVRRLKPRFSRKEIAQALDEAAEIADAITRA